MWEVYCYTVLKINFSCNVSISGTFTMKHYLAYKNEINKFAFKHSSSFAQVLRRHHLGIRTLNKHIICSELLWTLNIHCFLGMQLWGHFKLLVPESVTPMYFPRSSSKYRNSNWVNELYTSKRANLLLGLKKNTRKHIFKSSDILKDYGFSWTKNNILWLI